MPVVSNSRADQIKEVGQKVREGLMNKPGLAMSGSAATGALLVFVLQTQGETAKQSTDILDALSAQTAQITMVLSNQTEIRGDIQHQAAMIETVKLNAQQMSKRQDRLEREQRDQANAALQLRAEMGDWMRRQVGSQVDSHVDMVSMVAESVVDMERANVVDVWTERGPPYADTNVLSRRLGMRVSADVRDQAAALLKMARTKR